MTLPALTRTWQFQVNQVAPALGTTLANARRLMRMLKDSLKGSGAWTDSLGAAVASSGNWAVRSSCDGSGGAGSFGNGDGVDRWSSDASLVWAAAGSNHSWIVLRQTGIAATYEVCIDLSNAAANVCTVEVAFGGYNLDGTATARPTPVAGQVLLNAGNWGAATSDWPTVLHVLKSADGAATRILMTRSSNNASGVGTTGFWLFEVPRAASAAWTNPSVALVCPGSTSFASVDTSANTSNAGNTWSRTAGGTNFQSWWAAEGTTARSLINDTYGGPGNGFACALSDINDQFPNWPIALYSTTANARGVNGELIDMWWGIDQTGSTNVAQTRSWPVAGPSARQFMQFGAFVHPWNRSIPRNLS